MNKYHTYPTTSSLILFDLIFLDFIINPFFLNLYLIIPSIIEKVKGPSVTYTG